MSFNAYLLLSTFFPHYLPDPIDYFSLENFLPVFRHPHYMQINRIHRMRTVSTLNFLAHRIAQSCFAPKFVLCCRVGHPLFTEEFDKAIY
uniref:Uncharacterized protein n=1 Tax=Candidatus Kentrum eta TaxID=2126337 RepID=A0A450VUS4_9GAMM|nr:MAG: hypothetical protein BECKH772B_GA0070898_104642 [Candidatus Kentron sp. H]VFK04806.1 MAG: hypothetical protein BECKH772A_GA0070896_104632 [Candidatus Kentron sp. H]VFK08527.1 MAG: hypothetical protein BECKH772C_GA0070978_105221 [Candidatus Kentron sp. H]